MQYYHTCLPILTHEYVCICADRRVKVDKTWFPVLSSPFCTDCKYICLMISLGRADRHPKYDIKEYNTTSGARLALLHIL